MNVYEIMRMLIWGGMALFFKLLPIIFIILIIKSIKRVDKEVRKENMSKIDFARDVDYYRDVLDEYSIAVLSYIDDFQIKGKREIIATLLNLCLKKKIDINENEIFVLDSNLLGLKRSERFIMQNIVNGKVRFENENEFHQEVQKEAIEENLIEKNSDKTIKNRLVKKRMKKIASSILFIVLFTIFCVNVEKLNELPSEVLDLIMPIIAIICFLGFIKAFGSFGFSDIVYFALQLNSHKRTTKGEEINKKIEGLRQYINDYSLLSQAEKESLELWEDYLLYTIIFDMNTTGIVEKMSKLIDIKYEIGKIYVERTE